MDFNARSELDMKIAILGQAVASLVADMRLELAALRLLLKEQGVFSEDELNRRVEKLRPSRLPTLLSETSGQLQRRFERLTEQAGLSGSTEETLL
jgi:hypothetical protein